tara:strand:+ start:233 stop:754 length:522 start_codon:yes stop_codon:yes gene_type:complete
MTALENTPTNPNFLSPLNFKFSIKRAPHVNFFVQKVNLPAISLPTIETPTPFVKIPQPGEHLDYADLTLSFRVDENLQNYLEIHNWIRALGKPKDFSEYKALAQNPNYTGDGLRSDLALMILSSAKNPNYEIVFTDAYPYDISELSFDTTKSDVEFIEATATFKYILFEIKNV